MLVQHALLSLMLKIVFTNALSFLPNFSSNWVKYFSFMPPQPTKKKGEKVWNNFSPFLSPDLVILQNRHQILWLILWLNYIWICPRNLLQISSQYISPNSVTPKNHHWIWWKIFHNISRYLWFQKKTHQDCHDICHQIWRFTKTVTKFGEKNHTLLITKHPSVPSSSFGSNCNSKAPEVLVQFFLLPHPIQSLENQTDVIL